MNVKFHKIHKGLKLKQVQFFFFHLCIEDMDILKNRCVSEKDTFCSISIFCLIKFLSQH